MCGIVGIYLKSKKFEKSLGGMLSKMLVSMESRGPDSAGFAIYNSDKNKTYKYSICLNEMSFEKSIISETFFCRAVGNGLIPHFTGIGEACHFVIDSEMISETI